MNSKASAPAAAADSDDDVKTKMIQKHIQKHMVDNNLVH